MLVPSREVTVGMGCSLSGRWSAAVHRKIRAAGRCSTSPAPIKTNPVRGGPAGSPGSAARAGWSYGGGTGRAELDRARLAGRAPGAGGCRTDRHGGRHRVEGQVEGPMRLEAPDSQASAASATWRLGRCSTWSPSGAWSGSCRPRWLLGNPTGGGAAVGPAAGGRGAPPQARAPARGAPPQVRVEGRPDVTAAGPER